MNQTIRKYVGVYVGYDDPNHLGFGALPEVLDTDFGGKGTIPFTRSSVKYYPIDVEIEQGGRQC